MLMARAVLDNLRTGGQAIPSGPVRDAFDQVLETAAKYLANPNENTHHALAMLYDDSRDQPYPD